MNSFDKVKHFLESINNENISFRKHFYDQIKNRPISWDLVIKYLRKTENLLKVEKQTSKNKNEEKYKLWIKLSNKYSLVVIIVISKKDLYIVTSWNTYKKWQKSIRK